ncbi:MAG: hypothetical protein ACE5GB_00190 [Acidimicrobiales bacterium]
MCTRTVGTLAHVFEAAGLATVGISLVRGQAESVGAPRLLPCEFPLGRPLGRPDDAARQRDVISKALELLGRLDVPVIEDYPLVIEDQSDEPATCPLPARFDPDLPAALDEARGIRGAYERSVAAHGRTLVGRRAGADGIEGLLTTFIELAGGASLDDVGWSAEDLWAAAQDVRAYYEEAGLELADVTGARRIESWFYGTTATGALLRDVRRRLRDAGVDRNVWYYLMPGTQPD